MLQGGSLGAPHSLQQLLLAPKALLSRRTLLLCIMFRITWRTPQKPAALAVPLQITTCGPGAALPAVSNTGFTKHRGKDYYLVLFTA
jgi:hypothetical protein